MSAKTLLRLVANGWNVHLEWRHFTQRCAMCWFLARHISLQPSNPPVYTCSTHILPFPPVSSGVFLLPENSLAVLWWICLCWICLGWTKPALLQCVHVGPTLFPGATQGYRITITQQHPLDGPRNWGNTLTTALSIHDAGVPGDFGRTNLVLCPDIVHSVAFSWNLVTKRHKVQFGFGDGSVKWESRAGRSLGVLLVSRLFLTGEEAFLVGAADPCCYAQEHHNHHQHAQHNPNHVDVVCGDRIRGSGREELQCQGGNSGRAAVMHLQTSMSWGGHSA